MTKNPERSELEYLRAENRKLKREIRELKKSVSRSHKLSKRFVKEIEDREEEELVTHEELFYTPKNPDCPNCTRELIVVDLGSRNLYRCTGCKFRVSKIKETEES